MLILKNGEYQTVTPDTLSEIPMFQPSYEEQVAELIRKKYTIDEEFAIQRQRETKPEEFLAYFTYCESCKKEAKELLNCSVR